MSGIIINAEARTSKAEKDLESLNKSVKNIEETSGRAAKAMALMAKAFGAIAVGGAGLAYVKNISAEFTRMENKIATVTGRTKELGRVQKQLLDLSLETRQSYEATVSLYASLGRSLKGTTKDSQKLLGAAKTIQQAIALSGADAQTARAAIIQLGQGLSAGALRGEELLSVMENAPRLAQAIADNLGVTTGKMRLLAAEGRITTKVVFDALRKQSGAISKEFSALAPSINTSITKLGINVKVFVNEFTKGLGVMTDVGGIINKLAERVSELTENAYQMGANIRIFLQDIRLVLTPLVKLASVLAKQFLMMVPSITATAGNFRRWLIYVTRGINYVFGGFFQWFRRYQISALFKWENDIELAVKRLRRLSPRYLLGAGFNLPTIRKLFSREYLDEYRGAIMQLVDAIEGSPDTLGGRLGKNLENLGTTISFWYQQITRFMGFRLDTFFTFKRGSLDPFFRTLASVQRSITNTSAYFFQIRRIVEQYALPSFQVFFRNVKYSFLPAMEQLARGIGTTLKLLFETGRRVGQLMRDLVFQFSIQELISLSIHNQKRFNKLMRGFFKQAALDVRDAVVDIAKSWSGFGDLFDIRPSHMARIRRRIDTFTRGIAKTFSKAFDRLAGNDLVARVLEPFEKVSEVFSRAFSAVSSSAEKFARVVSRVFRFVKLLFTDFRGALNELFASPSKMSLGNFFLALVYAFNPIKFTHVLHPFWALLRDINAWGRDMNKFYGMGKGVVGRLFVLNAKLRGWVNEHVGIFSSFGVRAREAFREAFLYDINPFKDRLDDFRYVVRYFLTTVTIMFRNFGDLVADIWNDFLDGIDGSTFSFGGVVSSIAAFGKKVVAVFRDIYHQVIGGSYWTDTVEAVRDSSRRLWPDVRSGLENFRKNVIRLFKMIRDRKFRIELREIDIGEHAIKFPVIRAKNFGDDVLDTIRRIKDEIDKVIAAFPSTLKAIAYTLSAVLVTTLLPSGKLKSIIITLFVSAIISAGPVIARELGKNMTGQDFVNALGYGLGRAFSALVTHMVESAPKILNALTGVVAAFVRGFLENIPLLGKGLKAVFVGLNSLGLKNIAGLSVALAGLFKVLGSGSTFKVPGKYFGHLLNPLLQLFTLVKTGDTSKSGVITKILWGNGTPVSMLAALAAVMDYFGAFNSIFVNSPLAHAIARGGMVYLVLTGGAGLSGIKRLASRMWASVMGPVARYARGALGTGLITQTLLSKQGGAAENISRFVAAFFLKLNGAIIDWAAKALPPVGKFIRTALFGGDYSGTFAAIKRSMTSVFTRLVAWISTQRLKIQGALSGLFSGAKGTKIGAALSEFFAPPTRFRPVAGMSLMDWDKGAGGYVPQRAGVEGLMRQEAQQYKFLEARKMQDAAFITSGLTGGKTPVTRGLERTAARFNARYPNGLIGSLLFGPGKISATTSRLTRLGKFAVGGTLLAVGSLLASKAFAGDADANKAPDKVDSILSRLKDFARENPLKTVLIETAALVAVLGAGMLAFQRSAAGAAAALRAVTAAQAGAFGSGLGGLAGFTLAAANSDEIQDQIAGAMIGAVAGNFLLGKIAPFAGKLGEGIWTFVANGFKGALSGGFTLAGIGRFLFVALKGVVGRIFIPGALVGSVLLWLFGEKGQFWNNVKEYFSKFKDFAVEAFGGTVAPSLERDQGISREQSAFLTSKGIVPGYDLATIDRSKLTDRQRKNLEDNLKSFGDEINRAMNEADLGNFEESRGILETRVRSLKNLTDKYSGKTAFIMDRFDEESASLFASLPESPAMAATDWLWQLGLDSIYQFKRTNERLVLAAQKAVGDDQGRFATQARLEDLRQRRGTDFSVDFKRFQRFRGDEMREAWEGFKDLENGSSELNSTLSTLAVNWAKTVKEIRRNELWAPSKTKEQRRKDLEQLKLQLWNIVQAFKLAGKAQEQFARETAQIEAFQSALQRVQGNLTDIGINVDFKELLVTDEEIDDLEAFGNKAKELKKAFENARTAEELTAASNAMARLALEIEKLEAKRPLRDIIRDKYQLKEGIGEALDLNLGDDFFERLDDDMATGLLESLTRLKTLNIDKKIGRLPSIQIGTTLDTKDVSRLPNLMYDATEAEFRRAAEDLGQGWDEFAINDAVAYLFEDGKINSKLATVVPRFNARLNKWVKEVTLNMDAQAAEVEAHAEKMRLVERTFSALRNDLQAGAGVAGIDLATLFTNLGKTKGLLKINEMLDIMERLRVASANSDYQGLYEATMAQQALMEEINRAPSDYQGALGSLTTLGYDIPTGGYAIVNPDQVEQLKAVDQKVRDMTFNLSKLKGNFDAKALEEYNRELREARRLAEGLYEVFLRGSPTELLRTSGLDYAQIARLGDDYQEAVDSAVELEVLEKRIRNNQAGAVAQRVAAEKRFAAFKEKQDLKLAENQRQLINEQLGLQVESLDFFRMSPKRRASLVRYADYVRSKMREIAEYGQTVAGESAQSMLLSFRKAFEQIRLGELVASASREMTDGFVGSFKEGFERIRQLTERTPLELRAFMKLAPDTREAERRDAVALGTLRELSLQTELPPGVQEALESLSYDNVQAVFSEIQSLMGDALPVTPLDANSLAVGENTSAIRENTAAILGKGASGSANPWGGRAPIEELAATAQKWAVPNTSTTATENVERVSALKEFVAAIDRYNAGDNTKLLELADLGQAKEDLNRLTASELKMYEAAAATVAAMRINIENASGDQEFIQREQARVDAEIKRIGEFMEEALENFREVVEQAGKSFSSSIRENFRTGLKDVLKGKSSIADFGRSILDNFVENTIDNFVEGLLYPIMKDRGPVDEKLRGLGEEIFTGPGVLAGRKDETGRPAGTTATGGFFNQLLTGMFGGGEEGAGGGGLFGMLGGLFGGEKKTPLEELAVTSQRMAVPGAGGLDLGFGGMGGIGGIGGPSLTSGIMPGEWGAIPGVTPPGGEGEQPGLNPEIFNSGIGKLGGIMTTVGGFINTQGDKSSSLIGNILTFLPIIQSLLALSSIDIFKSGGPVKGPGTGTSDSILARLSNGEYVVNAAAARENYALLEAINTGKHAAVRRFAYGGLVDTSLAVARPGKVPRGRSGQQVFNINITGDISRQTKSEIYRMMPNIAKGVNMENRETGFKYQ